MTLKKFIPPILILLATVTIVGWQTLAFTPAAPKDDESFSLTVTINSRHINHFEACVPVKVDQPFRVLWGSEKVKDGFSGVLHKPKDKKYPITFNVSEGNGSCREMTVPSLTLDKPEKWSILVSALFKHIDSRELVLSKTPCPEPKNEP